MLIRRARRVGDFLGADSLAIAVQRSGDRDGLSDADREAIERHLNFARNLRSRRASSKAIRWRRRWWISRAATR